MSGEGDDERGERPRLSWREIDRRRDGSGRRAAQERRPRGAAAEARSRQATHEYLKRLDNLFSQEKGGAEAERLARAVREAHGTPQLAEACRAYCDRLGVPGDPGLLSLFLDAGERDVVVLALRALAELAPGGEQRLPGGMRSQLRLLAEDPDDEIAEAAEQVLAAL